MQKSSSTLPSLIDDLRAEMRRSPRRAHLHELARHRIDAPHEIIDWAKRDRRWSYTLAEIMNDKEAPHAARASAANSLLRKTVPDLQSTKVTGSDDGPLIIQIVKFANASSA